MDRWDLVRERWVARIAMVLLVWGCFSVLASPVQAGETLSIRLVEAHNEGEGMDAGLSDVASTLTKNLSYKTFSLLASRRLGLPADGRAGLSGGYSVACRGEQANLHVTVFKRKEAVLDTTLNLRDGSPVVLGGFASKRGRVLLVLIAR